MDQCVLLLRTILSIEKQIETNTQKVDDAADHCVSRFSLVIVCGDLIYA